MCPQVCGAPTCNLRSLAALFHEKEEGVARGGRGLLIGSVRGRIGRAFNRIEGE
jgi:hypothetical protein